MKASKLYLLSAVLLIVGFICIWSVWHGTANLTSGAPVGVSSIQFCGSASGTRVLIGFVVGVAGLIVYAVALVRTMMDEVGK